jgi:hypothetical protein
MPRNSQSVYPAERDWLIKRANRPWRWHRSVVCDSNGKVLFDAGDWKEAKLVVWAVNNVDRIPEDRPQPSSPDELTLRRKHQIGQ